jgi:Zn-finger nucleic acid-binding protein
MMLCPSCKTNLTMSERQGIEIDYCPSCRGVWLDRGELDKIIERSAESAPPQHQAPPPPPQGYQQPWGGAGHDPRYHKKRRKNFLEELFD